MRRIAMSLLLAVGLVSAGARAPARAEIGEITIAQQYGLLYLALMVMEKNHLLEKHLAAAGLPSTKVSWVKFTGSSAGVDAVISGNVHLSAQGTPSMALLWDRTKGRLEVKGMAALCDGNIWINTRNPNVQEREGLHRARTASRSLAEIVDPGDPAADGGRAGVRERTVRPAGAADRDDVASGFGDRDPQSRPRGDRACRDVALPRSRDEGGDAHRHLRLRHSRRAGDDLEPRDIVKFREENPKSYTASIAALDEAFAWINADKRRAAKLYIEMTNERRMSEDEVYAILTAPGAEWRQDPAQGRQARRSSCTTSAR